MLEFTRISLLDDTEYEDYDVNVVKLTEQEAKEFGLVKKTCCGNNGGCSKQSGKGSCCGNKKNC